MFKYLFTLRCADKSSLFSKCIGHYLTVSSLRKPDMLKIECFAHLHLFTQNKIKQDLKSSLVEIIPLMKQGEHATTPKEKCI